jgi:S-adenosylmethionine:tRNA ribosyltransferase-isomerase
VYAEYEGSVAAPTAGLHFTDEALGKLKEKHIKKGYVTLHVGAGTFKPITAENIQNHQMHTERISFSRELIKMLIDNDKNHTLAVGTTSVRTLESIYWFGIRVIKKHQVNNELKIGQWEPYTYDTPVNVPAKDSLEAVLGFMEKYDLTNLTGCTSLMIIPGYVYRIPDIMLTNFHMPRSSLLLLVAAFIGNDWRMVYQYALDHQFRFLSYGDSCLLFKNLVNE